MFIGSKKALVCGVLAVTVALIGQLFVGQVISGYGSQTITRIGSSFITFFEHPSARVKRSSKFLVSKIYYVLTSVIATLMGLVVAIILMLLSAITSLIDVVRPTLDEEFDRR